MTRKLVPAAAVAVIALVLPASASAAPTCQLNGSTLEIDAGSGDTFVMVTREAVGDADIVVSTTGSLPANVTCTGSPTINNVNLIDFDETSAAAQNTTLFADLRRGPLAPGLTDELDGSSEIEIDVDMIDQAASSDGFSVSDIDGLTPHHFRFGEDPLSPDAGGNLNADEAVDDVDVTATGIDRFYAEGDDGADTLTANGTAVPGFADPVAFDVTLSGNNDGDTIVGGTGTNFLIGADGDDVITGGPNSDNIQIGGGNDVADAGGSNADYASYLNHNQGVTVDLRQQGAAQDTVGAGTDTLTNFESVLGGNQSDTLIGDDGPNSLVGGQLGNDTGADVLRGNGGADFLSGGPGNDSLYPGAGDDSLIGAEGSDTLNYDDDGSTAGVTISLDASLTGSPQNTGGSGMDTLSDSVTTVGSDHEIENIVGSPFPGDSLTGSAANNVIRAYDSQTDTVNCAGGAGDLAVLDDLGVETANANCETADNAPRTSIASGPADGAATNDSTPTYDLAADKPATFELNVDNDGFAPCADPCTTPVLADGSHIVAFRAIDTDGNDNPELTAVEREVIIDSAAPGVQITAGPALLSNDPTPTWAFASSDSSASFECRIAPASFAACSGPGGAHTEQVADGPQTFEVRATDAAGNTSTATGAAFVDTRAPDTTSNGPSGKTAKARARIKNLADEGNVSFECKLDKRAYKPCGSTFTKKVKVGKHKVRVRAVDAAGNTDPTPAVVRWRRVEKS